MNILNQIKVLTNQSIDKVLYISAINHQNQVYLPIKILICGLEKSYIKPK